MTASVPLLTSRSSSQEGIASRSIRQKRISFSVGVP